MAETIVVTTLVENSVSARGLLAEHGLAFHIQAGPHNLLFDTGQSSLLAENARKLGVPLEQVEAIALSHGHNDHTGGLSAARAAASGTRLFLHPASLSPKFAAKPDGTVHAIGMDDGSVEAIRAEPGAVVWTVRPAELVPGIFVTGEIPRRNAFEDTGGRFFLDAASTHPDLLLDDQALFFDTQQGLVVLLGCGHAGVVNTLEYIRHLTGERPIHTVMGGMHLLAAGPERMEQTFAAFRRLDIPCLAPAHCTGLPAIARLWTAFPTRCVACGVGVSHSWNR
jgi:7,8-dihydropterin-6-yl-methyl-4-(beta-D-ribofuranosyl)aminobenzene 5'-phosphate synthase